ncbi:MAG TPA: haloacid dehalogenase-like hydrolase [Streptosporangiaceae bacterium]
MAPTTLVLWDIDHTLIETGGVGSEVYAAAFHQVTGRPLEHMAELAGRTEPVIFRETLQQHHISDPDTIFNQFAAAQARGYTDRTEELRQRGRALPGAVEALQSLSADHGIVQSVLTGNTRESARIKLRAFGLDTHLDLDIGAYGTDNDERPSLVPIARHRATVVHHARFDGPATILIGDTPNDVTAALSSHARVIAVATGKDSTADLAAAGADTVFADLTDTAALLAAIHGNQPQ